MRSPALAGQRERRAAAAACRLPARSRQAHQTHVGPGAQTGQGCLALCCWSFSQRNARTHGARGAILTLGFCPLHQRPSAAEVMKQLGVIRKEMPKHQVDYGMSSYEGSSPSASQ
jgi:hypothetical protein